MKIVFLDAKTIGDDIDLSGFDALGEVTKYNFSTPEEVPDRVKDADIIITNKIPINEQTIGTAKNAKLVCVTATGTNNLDKAYLDAKGVPYVEATGNTNDEVIAAASVLISEEVDAIFTPTDNTISRKD